MFFQFGNLHRMNTLLGTIQEINWAVLMEFELALYNLIYKTHSSRCMLPTHPFPTLSQVILLALDN